MTIVIFAGPSLHGVDRARLKDVDLRSPAKKGDILTAMRDGASAVGLIDGTFEYGASIWHKEILFALREGIAVFGAASMGALRAAECAPFGMIGVGEVFEDYRTGRRRSDGDVAMVHGPAALDYQPLTEALVDIEATLDRMMSSGSLAEGLAVRLRMAARQLHFKERSWTQVLAAARSEDANLLDQLRRARFSIKTVDALAMIDRMRAPTAQLAGPRPDFEFNHTLFFQELLNEHGVATK